MHVMPKVFISYAKKDYIASDGNVIPNNLIDKLTASFSKEGVSYWIDRERLAPGDTYAARITRNIRECDVFLFLSSKAANESEWTTREIATAISSGKRIIPVLTDDSHFNDAVSLYLSSVQYVDWREQGEKRSLERINRMILHPGQDESSSIEAGKLPRFTNAILYAALIILTGIYAFLTWLFLWAKTLQTSEVIGGLIGLIGEIALLLSIYYVLRILRRRRCVFALPALLVGLMLASALVTVRVDLFICSALLLAGWVGIALACMVRSSSRKSFFSQMNRSQSLLKLNDPENLILVYLLVKTAIVILGHFIEGFMNLAEYLEVFRY